MESETDLPLSMPLSVHLKLKCIPFKKVCSVADNSTRRCIGVLKIGSTNWGYIRRGLRGNILMYISKKKQKGLFETPALETAKCAQGIQLRDRKPDDTGIRDDTDIRGLPQTELMLRIVVKNNVRWFVH